MDHLTTAHSSAWKTAHQLRRELESDLFESIREQNVTDQTARDMRDLDVLINWIESSYEAMSLIHTIRAFTAQHPIMTSAIEATFSPDKARHILAALDRLQLSRRWSGINGKLAAQERARQEKRAAYELAHPPIRFRMAS